MIAEHASKKCSKCQREHNAPGNICFICINEVINTPLIPRVGIARRDELVILECDSSVTEQEKCRVSDELARVRKDTGIRFLILDPAIRLARVFDDKRQKELEAWRKAWEGAGFYYDAERDKIVSKDEDGEVIA